MGLGGGRKFGDVVRPLTEKGYSVQGLRNWRTEGTKLCALAAAGKFLQKDSCLRPC